MIIELIKHNPLCGCECCVLHIKAHKQVNSLYKKHNHQEKEDTTTKTCIKCMEEKLRRKQVVVVVGELVFYTKSMM